MKITPLGERILVRPIEAEQKTKGGIYIPDTAKEKPRQGEVVAVGELKAVQIKVGDKVMYESFAGTDVEIEGKKHILMQAKDVLAKFE